MAEKITYKIKLLGSDGNEYNADLGWLKNYLGIPYYMDASYLDRLQSAKVDHEVRLNALEHPSRVNKILEILSKNQPLTTRKFKRLVDSNYFYVDVAQLVKTGLITEIKQKGRGAPHLYQLKEKNQSQPLHKEEASS